MYPQIFPCPDSTREQVGWAGCSDFHNGGFDIFGNKRDNVLDTVPGNVTKAGWVSGGGNRVGITDDEGIYHYFAHLDEVLVSEGQRVNPGDLIGRMGNTGAEWTSPHLHYALRRGDGDWFTNDWYPELIRAFENQAQPQPIPEVKREEQMSKGKYVEVPGVTTSTRIAVTNSTRNPDDTGETINVVFAFMTNDARMIFSDGLKMKAFQTHTFTVSDAAGVPSDFAGTVFVEAESGEVTVRVL